MIGVGAAVGALLRMLLMGLPGPDIYWLLLINVAGSALMGYAKPKETVGVGILGGLTSFSSFIALSTTGSIVAGAAYVVVTVVLCTGGYLAGDRFSPGTSPATKVAS